MNSYVNELAPGSRRAPSKKPGAPARRRRSAKQVRSPGELTTRRLRVNTTDGMPTMRPVPFPSDEAFCARLDELLYRGAPCWRTPYCVLRRGHGGECEQPTTRGLRPEDVADEEKDEEEDADVDAE